MSAYANGPRRETLTGSRHAPNRGREGVIAGYLFKVIREQIPRTQDELAEELAIDKSTVQGWESGRRPLAATRVGNLITVRRKLVRLGAPSELVEALNTAMDADFMLSASMSFDPSRDAVEDHPLAGWVLSRANTHMLGWAVSGVVPGVVAAACRIPAARRGPVAESPLLDHGARTHFFANLRAAAGAADPAEDHAVLLRRQVAYLSSYDHDWKAAEWVAQAKRIGRLEIVPAGWTPRWAEARSAAAAMARQGDPELLRDFIARSLTGDDAAESANLNYWAHWVGLDSRPQTDDLFMSERGRSAWDASALLRQFADRLDRAAEYTELYVHSVSALLLARPRLLEADPLVAQDLLAKANTLLERGGLSVQGRRELEGVHYGLRMSGISTIGK